MILKTEGLGFFIKISFSVKTVFGHCHSSFSFGTPNEDVFAVLMTKEKFLWKKSILVLILHQTVLVTHANYWGYREQEFSSYTHRGQQAETTPPIVAQLRISPPTSGKRRRRNTVCACAPQAWKTPTSSPKGPAEGQVCWDPWGGPLETTDLQHTLTCAAVYRVYGERLGQTQTSCVCARTNHTNLALQSS